MSENKVALITGSARRIGASIVSKFHSEGFDVIVHARSSTDAAQELMEKMTQLAFFFPDFCHPNAIGHRLIAKVLFQESKVFN